MALDFGRGFTDDGRGMLHRPKPHTASALKFERRLENLVDLNGDAKAFFEKVQSYLNEKGGREGRSSAAAVNFALAKDLAASSNFALVGDAGMHLVWGLEDLAAAGDRTAGIELAKIATEAGVAIKALSMRKPAWFRAAAQHLEEWPGMISEHPDWKKDNKEIAEAIELGKHSPVYQRKRVTKRGSPKSKHRQLVHDYCYRMVEVVEVCADYYDNLRSRLATQGEPDLDESPLEPPALQQAAKLGPLTPQTAERWFDTAWALLVFISGERPERLPGLAAVGAYREDHWLPPGGWDPPEGTRLSNVRDGIHDRLRRAFLIRFGKRS